MLVSLLILIALRCIIYCCKQIDEHFPTQVQLCESVQHSWDISRQSFYSYWWPDISVICYCSCTSHICADSPHLGLSSTTWFVKISPLVVEIQAEWSLWHKEVINFDLLSLSIGAIICFLEELLVIILILNLTFSESLIILWMFSIFLVDRLRKFF